MIRTGPSRRQFLLASMAIACGAVAPLRTAFANSRPTGDDWDAFVAAMRALANDYDARRTTPDQLAPRGIAYLKAVAIGSASFAEAVAEAYESGNRFWLWQRMLKDANLNGGILHIGSDHLVQLHDHPGATGILRIISGEVEVWQYDRLSDQGDGSHTELQLTEHRILKPGDTAVLSPDKGNIHALRSISAECRMLDFFIPPYQRALRTWFEPVGNDWRTQDRITCRYIPEQAYEGA